MLVKSIAERGRYEFLFFPFKILLIPGYSSSCLTLQASATLQVWSKMDGPDSELLAIQVAATGVDAYAPGTIKYRALYDVNLFSAPG